MESTRGARLPLMFVHRLERRGSPAIPTTQHISYLDMEIMSVGGEIETSPRKLTNVPYWDVLLVLRKWIINYTYYNPDIQVGWIRPVNRLSTNLLTVTNFHGHPSKKGPFQKERIVFQALFFKGHVSFGGSFYLPETCIVCVLKLGPEIQYLKVKIDGTDTKRWISKGSL